MKNSLFINRITLFFYWLLLAAISLPLSSLGLNHWRSIESKHFIVSYNEDTEHLKEKVIQIAEDTVDTIAYYFGVEPIKFHIVLRDDQDIPYGGAFGLTPLVEINCRKVNMLWRGETHWLRAVLSHELAHLYSLNLMSPLAASLGLGASVSVGEKNVYVNGVGYINPISLPIWFIEGLSQLGSLEFKADFRDPYREMLLRDAFLNDLLLSYDQMGRFEGSVRESELVYNQGFDFLIFLRDQYPDVWMKRLCRDIRSMGFPAAIQKNYNKTIEVLYSDWKSLLEKRFAGAFDSIPGDKLFSIEPRTLNIETMALNKGKYAVANWQHDFEVLDLYRIGEGRSRTRLAENVGRIIKEDPSIETLYFTGKLYEAGANLFDLYQMDSSGNIKRITDQERVMAFDTQDGLLYYAAYDQGKGLLRKKEDHKIVDLLSLDYEKNIYSISCLAEDELYLTLGTGDKVQAVLFNQGELHYLWPRIKGDVLDLIVVEGQKLVFVSTINKTPQLYWCDKEELNTWFRMTNVSGGLRYPSYDSHSKQLSYSVYHKGHWSLYYSDNPFASQKSFQPIDLTPYFSPSAVSQGALEDNPIPKYKPAHSGLITYPLSLLVNYSASLQPEASSGIKMVNNLALGSRISLRSPPGDLELTAITEANFFMGESRTTVFYPYFKTSLLYQLGLLEWTLNYELQNSLNNFNVSQEQYINAWRSYHNVRTNFRFGVFDFLDFYLHYKYHLAIENSFQHLSVPGVFIETGTRSIHLLKDKLYNYSHTAGLDLYYFNSLSRFDPAHLGRPGVSANAGSAYTYSEFPDGFYSGDEFSYSHRIKTYGDIGFNWLILWNKLNLETIIDGLTLTPLISEGSRISFSLGSSNYFSGYPEGSLGFSHMARGQIEIRLNPFVNPDAQTFWFERWHLALKAELGYVNYFTSGSDSRWGWPLSLEAALRFYFYMSRYESSFYIKVGMPLFDIGPLLLDSLESIYKISIGFRLS